MSDKYILDGKKAVPCEDLIEWAKMFEESNRIVKQEEIGDVKVSTVFLGVDHYFGDGPHEPLIFETMIFGGEHNDYQTRCSTWEQAEEMHKKAVALVNGK